MVRCVHASIAHNSTLLLHKVVGAVDDVHVVQQKIFHDGSIRERLGLSIHSSLRRIHMNIVTIEYALIGHYCKLKL